MLVSLIQNNRKLVNNHNMSQMRYRGKFKGKSGQFVVILKKMEKKGKIDYKSRLLNADWKSQSSHSFNLSKANCLKLPKRETKIMEIGYIQITLRTNACYLEDTESVFLPFNYLVELSIQQVGLPFPALVWTLAFRNVFLKFSNLFTFRSFFSENQVDRDFYLIRRMVHTRYFCFISK